MSCIFCDIIAGRKPCRQVYEDEQVMAFHDIHPSAPVHVLLVPKKHLVSLAEAGPEDQALLGHMMLTLSSIALQLGLDTGFKTHINTGRGGGQEVFHLHMHLLGYKRNTNG